MTDTSGTAAPAPGASKLRWLVVAIPYLWLVVFFLVPFLIVLKISFSTYAIAQPPYEPVFDQLSTVWERAQQFTLDSYRYLTEDPIYLRSYLSSLRIAAISTVLLLLIGFPIAYGMARAPSNMRTTLLMLVILPFWTSFLIRVYAWIGILKPEGLLTVFLQWIGIFGPDQQVHLLNTDWAVFIGIVYSYLPFMILPLYATLEKLDDTLLEAAADLGARPFKSFWVITVPLSMPGVIAGSFLCFIPIVGEFVIPDLLGGSDTLMIGRQLWNEFNANRDWPTSSAVAVVLLLILVVPIMIFQNYGRRTAQ
ncbi:ABC transporter permease subunit [Mangrovicella endophytica]|uniref:ABC transporter permease subunit n=1 Tax=Mangrovicella endophytica TaxID=2066697 RepID=UPI000C9E47D3|nr:ABC transporter permease subunit [Mangrovicella endophytica]